MKTKTTLKALFESRKDELKQKLATLSLPKDAALVQQTVSNYLNDLFDSEGDFRQNLTQSEDYILQAAMSLLNAQQTMVHEFTIPKFTDSSSKSDDKQQPNTIPVSDFGGVLKKEQYSYVIGGTAVGGTAGALILGTWGSVFGAIAGTALVLYYSSQLPKSFGKINMTPLQEKNGAKTDVIEQKINVEVFANIVGNICDSVDSLIQTFRAQINRVVDKYESIEKPSLEQEYRFLIEGIQTLIGYKRTHADDDKYMSKLQMRIEDLAETLENYNLTVEDYNEENKSWFETVESTKFDSPKMVYPAIVKNGSIILHGKVFVPQK